jgi:hypothetical protein
MSQAARKRLVPRCRFRDPNSGRRCVEPGLGKPPYCLPHLTLVREGAADEDPFFEAFDTVLNHPKAADILGRVADFIDFATRRGLDRKQARPEDSPHYRGPGRGFHSEWPPRGQGQQDRQRDPRQNRQQSPRPSRHQVDPRSVLGIPPGVPLTASLIKKHQRALATIHHPDSGGTTAAMQSINSAATALLAQCS